MDESFLNSVFDINSDRIIICCDNLFGSVGCHVFSHEKIDKFHYIMHSILRLDKNIKVLLGIHEHVIDELSSNHLLILQEYKAIVELDISQSEALLIYIVQKERSNMKQDYMPFDDFLEVIENRSAFSGTPFQTLMISSSPVVFGTKAFCNQPFQQLTEHFTKLYHCDKEMFCSLFISCV